MMKTYKTLSCRVTGYRKRAGGKPCEDATKVIRTKNATVISVADGHGDTCCLFAHIGAQLAVRAACEVLKAYEMKIGKEHPSVYWNARRTAIAQDIVKCFSRFAVEDYVSRCPSSVAPGERDALLGYIEKEYSQEKEICAPEEIRQRYLQKKRTGDRLQSILYLYGTTLRASLISDRYAFHLAIGDGDTILLTEDGVQWVLPKSEAYACETASLCESAETVIDDFLFSYTEIREKDTGNRKLPDLGVCPRLIALSTDGLRNSFYEERAFAEKINDVYDVWRSGGGNCSRALRTLFDRLTRESVFQDDISAVFCFFPDF